MHTHACAHTQSNTSLCLPTLSDPLLTGVLSLSQSLILLCTRESTVVLGAPGIMEHVRRDRKHWAPITCLLSDTAPVHTPQVLLFSPPREGCSLTRTPGDNAQGDPEVVRNRGYFPF